jgi:hypothetical protein
VTVLRGGDCCVGGCGSSKSGATVGTSRTGDAMFCPSGSKSDLDINPSGKSGVHGGSDILNDSSLGGA